MSASWALAPGGNSGWKPCSSMEAWAAATRLNCAVGVEFMRETAPDKDNQGYHGSPAASVAAEAVRREVRRESLALIGVWEGHRNGGFWRENGEKGGFWGTSVYSSANIPIS